MGISSRAVEYLTRTISQSSLKKSLICALAPIVLFSVAAVGFIAFYFLGDLLHFPKIPSPFNNYVGFPCIVIGLILMTGSTGQFLLNRGTPVPMKPPPQLVSNGLYKYVRNPMFGGLFLFILGLGIILGSLGVITLYLPTLVTLVTWEIKTIEEPELERRLGKAYVDYRKQTPRFIPRFFRTVKPVK